MNIKRLSHAALLCAVFAGGSTPHADEKPAKESTPSAAPKAEIKTRLATKTEWASGLKEPQGMAIDGKGNILLADYGAGKILRYSRSGKLLGTLAEGLKSPTQIVVGIRNVSIKSKSHSLKTVETIYVSERKANRVIKISPSGKISPVGQAIEEPLGLAYGPKSELFAVSHTTSKIYHFDGMQWHLIFAAPLEAGDDKRYGYRCLTFEDGAFLMSDEVGEQVVMLTPNGRLATWAKGIAAPSGITIGPDGFTYVTDESEGGRLYRVNNLGEKTIVAEGLGRPRGVLFLDAKTVLVSDRNGKVWKLVLP